MSKFNIVELIETDDAGYLVLKGMLPSGSIAWARSVDKKVIVRLQSGVNIRYIEKHFNSIHRTLNN